MFNTNDFIFTSETTPQVTTDLTGCVKQVDELIGIADAVNVTDSPMISTKSFEALAYAVVSQRKNGSCGKCGVFSTSYANR